MRTNLSIIIPSFKRSNHVVNLLQSFKGKLINGTEVIIVEQKENNERVFKETAKKLGLDLKYVYLPTPSTPNARNVGIEKAQGEIILFFDDDCIVKTSIEGPLKEFNDPKVAAVVGRAYVEGEMETISKVGAISFLGKFNDGFNSSKRQEVDSVIGCHMYWKKSILKRVGKFDTQFTGNALREETDMSLRARKSGYKIIYNPSAIVLHVRADSGGARKTEGRIQWYFDFFSNETYFFLKYWPFWTVPIIILTRGEWALRCMFGFGREVSLGSISAPFVGILDGYKKYRRWKNENRS